MRSHPTPPRSPGLAAGILVAVAVALAAAFVVAPPVLAGLRSGGELDGERRLAGAFRAEFVPYWHAGGPAFPPGLQRLVDYWVRYHVVKAVLAAALLVVLVALGVLIWTAVLRAGGLRAATRVALGSAGVLVTTLALCSLALVMANVQGAVAPFASLLPMLTGDPTDAGLTHTLAQVRQELADSRNPGAHVRPAVEVMVGDFSRYHLAMAVIAAIVAVGLAALAVLAWRRAGTRPADRRTQRALRSFGVLSTLFSLAATVVVVANTTTAADPTPALLAFFQGGW
jgi:hypothetical protein